MAFVLQNWAQVNASTNNAASDVWSYINLQDTALTMLTAGYFNQQAAILAVGDAILATGSDLTKLLRVTAVSNSNAQTYSVTVASDFVNDAPNAGLEVLVEGTVTSDQMLSFATLPIEIIPAPGDGVAAVPVDLVLEYKFNTTPYTITGTPSITLAWYDASGPTVTPACLNIAATGFVDQTVDTLSFSLGYSSTPFPSSQVTNIPVIIAMGGGTDLTDGDGTLDYKLVYRLFTL